MAPSSFTPAGTRSARAWSAATLGSGVEVAPPPALSPPPVPVDESPPPQPVSARAELVIATAATARRRMGLVWCTGYSSLRDRRRDLPLPAQPVVHLGFCGTRGPRRLLRDDGSGGSRRTMSGAPGSGCPSGPDVSGTPPALRAVLTLQLVLPPGARVSSAVLSPAVPALAQRLSGVASSPVRELLALLDRPGVISFAGGMPAPELFDLDGVRAAYDSVLWGPAARRALQYAPTEGDRELRARVAARLTARGLLTTVDDLLVTSGSQQALTLVATALLDPGAVVLVEDPTYLAALQCFQLAGARVVPVPTDAEGMDPAALADALRREQAALVYLVPTFSNPTGRTMPEQRRAEIVELTARAGVWVVEDDPYGELRYRGAAVAPLAAHAGAEQHVLHLGSFSKIAAPGLRLGGLRAPSSVLPALTVAKQAADLHTSTIDQAAAAAWFAATDVEAHVLHLRAASRLRRDAMVQALPGVLPAGSSWTDPDGGMFVWARLPGAIDTAQLLGPALHADVAFVPGAAFYAGTPDRATLRLSFTTHTPERIVEGLDRLGGVLRG